MSKIEQREVFRELLRLGFSAKFAKAVSEMGESLLDADVPQVNEPQTLLEYNIQSCDCNPKYNPGNKSMLDASEYRMNEMAKQGWKFLNMTYSESCKAMWLVFYRVKKSK